jgi:hypothetical protein
MVGLREVAAVLFFGGMVTNKLINIYKQIKNITLETFKKNDLLTFMKVRKRIKPGKSYIFIMCDML